MVEHAHKDTTTPWVPWEWQNKHILILCQQKLHHITFCNNNLAFETTQNSTLHHVVVLIICIMYGSSMATFIWLWFIPASSSLHDTSKYYFNVAVCQKCSYFSEHDPCYAFHDCIACIWCMYSCLNTCNSSTKNS